VQYAEAPLHLDMRSLCKWFVQCCLSMNIMTSWLESCSSCSWSPGFVMAEC